MSSIAIPTLSVVVNIYNEEDYLPQCLDSLANQTLIDIEVIMVDDGSKDSSPLICENYAKRFKNFNFIKKRNEGLVRARKDGLLAAQGKYLAFVDGDDWVEPEWFETLLSAAVEVDADVVAAGYKEDLLGNIQFGKNIIAPGVYSIERLKKEVFPRMINVGECSRFGLFTYLWNKLFRRELLLDTLLKVDDGIFIGEDACTLYPTILQSDTLVVLDYCGYHYRQRVGSMVKTGFDRECEFERLRRLSDYLKNAFCHSRYSDVLMPQLRMFMLSQIVVRMDGFLDDDANPLFPFDPLEKKGKVALFGAGTFGQHVFRRIQDYDGVELVLWVDERSEEYRSFGLNVSDVSDLAQADFDVVLVAILDEEARMSAKMLLRDFGIDEDKIRLVVLNENQKRNILEKFGL